MVIPKTIYQMNERANELTNKITVSPDSEKLNDLLSLIGMAGFTLAKITDYESFKRFAPELIKETKSHTNKAKRDPQQSLRIATFYYQDYIRDALNKDKKYQTLKTRLQRKSIIVPTTELSQNIIAYNKCSIMRCSFILMTHTDDKRILDVIPIADQLDTKIGLDKLDEQLIVRLASVNQCIDRYYRGNDGENKKDEE